MFWLRCLRNRAEAAEVRARVQISPDGQLWVDEGTVIDLPVGADAPAFARIRHFGGWLRLAVAMPEGARATVLVTLHLK